MLRFVFRRVVVCGLVLSGCSAGVESPSRVTTFGSASDGSGGGADTDGDAGTTIDESDGGVASTSGVSGADGSTSSGGEADEGGSSSDGDNTPKPTGCEEIDPPDINGLDENGDGIDGVACRAVFVNSLGGSDLNGGLAIDDPVASISRAIEIASSYDPPLDVLVAAGEYGETVNLSSGVGLYGGYDPQDWTRNIVTNETLVLGQEARAVVVENIGTASIIDGFTVEGADYQTGGLSTYAIWVRDTPENLLVIRNCTIIAGQGGAGSDASEAADGADGGHGSNATGGNGGAGGASACNAVGGNGGSGLSCPATAGGNGSAGESPTAVGQGGTPGASECSGNTCNDEGGNGALGQAGHTGIQGVGGELPGDARGAFAADGLWVPPQPQAASAGANGSGGGGGGAGGYDVDSGILCTFAAGTGVGGGGGGGGAGGCGGQAGEAGQGGGGSFGIVVIASSIELANTHIILGGGGNGGAGGSGGDGGVGGNGANGAHGINDGGEAGDGAAGRAGGAGGGGGGGAGGCGGAAVGLAEVGGSQVATGNVSFSGGVGGTGGPGGAGGHRGDNAALSAEAGQNGCAGFHGYEVTY